MLDRHAVQALLKAGQPSHKIAQQFGVSQRSIQRIAKEPPIETLDEVESRPSRGVGRPGVADRIRVRLRPQLPPRRSHRQAPPGDQVEDPREWKSDLSINKKDLSKII